MAPRKSSSAVLAALVLLGIVRPAQADGPGGACKFAADRVTRIDTTGAQSVEIVSRAGDLDVRPTNGTNLVGQGRACASREEYLAKMQVYARREGSVVRVWAEVPEEFKGIGMFYASIDLTVLVPAGLPVSIADTSGDLRVEGLAVTRIHDSSGDVVATRLLSDVEIDDSSGDVRIEGAAGRVTVSDSSGDIVVRDARDVRVKHDSSGDIVVQRISGDVSIDGDSSGDISVNDVGRNLTVLADTSGDVRVSGVKGTVSLPKD